MSSTPPANGRALVNGVEAASRTRARIVTAAFDLFSDRGYDGTTIDAVAERAGIARRTFFRYFRSKDDVIFPDHDALLETVRRHLSAASAAGAGPLPAVCGGARLVLEDYVADPVASVQRFRLSRSVPALRDREISSVRRYERAFSTYLAQRYGELGVPQAGLRGDVVAAAVVAAHNAVLRDWLRSGAADDPMPSLERAFGWVAGTFGDTTGAESAAGTDEVVVAVFRAGRPMDDVVERISRSL